MSVKQFCTHVVYPPSHDRISTASNSPIIPPVTKLRPLAEPHNSTPALVRNRARMLIEFLRFLICQDLCRTLLLLRIFCFCACRHPSPSASERKGAGMNRKEYTVINLIAEYEGRIAEFKYAVSSALPEEKLRKKYGTELKRYEPFL